MQFDDKTPQHFRIECQDCGVKFDDPNKDMAYMGWNHRPEEGGGFFKDYGLFDDRTAHACATQMAKVLAWMVECELATLARYERLKSSSKRETERHQEICDRLVRHCAELNIPPEGLDGKACPRLEERLESYSSDTE